MTPQKRLNARDILCLRSFLALLSLELDSITLFQGPESAARNGREVDKYVFAAIVWSDEPKTLIVIEPFHCIEPFRYALH
jgi:hypothetical protein